MIGRFTERMGVSEDDWLVHGLSEDDWSLPRMSEDDWSVYRTYGSE